MSDRFTITELAEQFGITTRAIRFYEDKGLISPARQGQSRIYSNRDRVRLVFIVRGRRLGFTLAEIKELLDLYDVRDGQVTQYRKAIAKFEERILLLERQRNELDEAISDLRRWTEMTREALEENLRSAKTPEGV